jgi:transcription elongation GreA/GreB family factor
LVHAAFIWLLSLFRLGERANRQEERHEKEGQEEIEGNIKNWNARLSREKYKKKSGPLMRGRFVIVPK